MAMLSGAMRPPAPRQVRKILVRREELVPGELLILWTIRAALAFACLAALCALSAGANGRRQRWRLFARGFWTLGCALFLTHVAGAFHFAHGWSHEHALQYTADQTELLTGWRFGGGLYFNYAFGLMWLVDVLMSWANASRRGVMSELPEAHEATVSGVHPLRIFWLAFFLFMVVNGAIVFAAGATRRVTAGGLVLIIVLAAFRWQRSRTTRQ